MTALTIQCVQTHWKKSTPTTGSAAKTITTTREEAARPQRRRRKSPSYTVRYPKLPTGFKIERKLKNVTFQPGFKNNNALNISA